MSGCVCSVTPSRLAGSNHRGSSLNQVETVHVGRVGRAVTAVAVGVLREVLLVLVLGVVVRRSRPDLGGDRAVAATGQLRLVCLRQRTRGVLLLGRRGVDRGAVL